MPVNFLTLAQREKYGRYANAPASEDMAHFFHLTADELVLISSKRGPHNRIGFALQLTTLRFLGTFLEDPLDVPSSIFASISRQLGILDLKNIDAYRNSRKRWLHTAEIKRYCGYYDFTDPKVGLRFSRWLYGLCWTGTERPSVVFDRAVDWLFTHKVVLPGRSTLERVVGRIRSRIEAHIFRLLVPKSKCQQKALEELLTIPKGNRTSLLDQLRSGPTRVSGPSLVNAIMRLKRVRSLGIRLKVTARISPSRIASLARFAQKSKVTAIARLPQPRRMATLAAFVHCLEAIAHDDVLEVLEMLLADIFRKAENADKIVRLRSLKDLDQSAMVLADACKAILDEELSDNELRRKIFERVSVDRLSCAVRKIQNLVRPPNDVYFQELEKRYRRVRIFLPTLIKHLHFDSNHAGKPVASALKWLDNKETRIENRYDIPQEVITDPWLPQGVRITK